MFDGTLIQVAQYRVDELRREGDRQRTVRLLRRMRRAAR